MIRVNPQGGAVAETDQAHHHGHVSAYPFLPTMLYTAPPVPRRFVAFA